MRSGIWDRHWKRQCDLTVVLKCHQYQLDLAGLVRNIIICYFEHIFVSDPRQFEYC